MALVYVGDATFVEKDPVDLKEHAPREWSPRGKMPKVYWYASFPSLERGNYGLAVLKGGPKSAWLDHEEVREVGFDPTAIAPYMDFGEGLSELLKGRKHGFEEVPYVEVKNKGDYEIAFLAWKGIEDPEEMTSQERRRIMDFELKGQSHWKGPGLYDFRDMTRGAKSVEEYEIDGMEYWANDLLDSGYDDDWESALRKLLERNL